MIKKASIDIGPDGIKFVNIEFADRNGAMLVILADEADYNDPVDAVRMEAEKVREQIRALEEKAETLEAGYNYLRALPADQVVPKCFWCGSKSGLKKIVWLNRYRCAMCEAHQGTRGCCMDPGAEGPEKCDNRCCRP